MSDAVAGPVTDPVIIEAAINGANPDAPRTPAEISACALACFAAGAAIVHNHIDLFGTADEAAIRYREGWDPVLAVRPDALLYPTINGVGPVEERYSHIAPLAEAGYLRIGVIDPGSVNLGASFAYVNAGADIEHQWQLCDRYGLVPGMSIFEPGFLRAALAYWRAGKLPPGTMLRFYFGGREAEADGGYTFGLAPTERALDAYLELLGECPLPWSVTVVGGDLFATDLPESALARGGHLRVGLEDHRGRRASNEELVAEAVARVRASGRPVADCVTAAGLLGLEPLG
ncbi:MAG TPA: 3-keto-5-aminohexanoate cleavage protein [Acidimicrobiia bacterium]|nr:3-keto-5-aminohexanoate cleavage protein [Acidimicrobiia bacterium]